MNEFEIVRIMEQQLSDCVQLARLSGSSQIAIWESNGELGRYTRLCNGFWVCASYVFKTMVTNLGAKPRHSSSSEEQFENEHCNLTLCFLLQFSGE